MNFTSNLLQKILFCFLLSLPVNLIAATEPLNPGEFKKWIYPGWKLIQIAHGDLNRDGKDDIVLVLQNEDPVNFKKNEGFGEKLLNLNPRRLLILFKNESGYELNTLVEKFLPSANDAESTCLEDPLDNGGVKISKGLLKIDLHYWSSCGGWSVSHDVWSFRHENNRFKLIGLDKWHFARNSGERSESSRNYLTGKIKRTTGMNEFTEGAKPSVVWKDMARRVLFLDEMTSGCWADDKVQEWCE